LLAHTGARYWKETSLLAAANIVSLGLNFVTAILVARTFGTSAQMDAYTLAVSIPESLQYLLMLATLSVVFAPLFIDYRTQHGEQAAWELALSLLLVVGGPLLAGALVDVVEVAAGSAQADTSSDAGCAVSLGVARTTTCTWFARWLEVRDECDEPRSDEHRRAGSSGAGEHAEPAHRPRRRCPPLRSRAAAHAGWGARAVRPRPARPLRR